MTNLINKITKFAMISFLAGTLNSCNLDYSKQEKSEILYEKGKVIATLCIPKSVSIDIPEIYGVVFKCKNKNKFSIQGSDEKYKKLWEKLDDEDSVKISYREIYKIKYDGQTNKAINKEVIDYEFINAETILSRGEEIK